MRRWHEEEPIARRNWRAHRRSHVDSNLRESGRSRVGLDPDEVDCPCDDQAGRFRKKKAFACSCHTCRCASYYKRLDPTGQEARADEDTALQLRELEDGDD